MIKIKEAERWRNDCQGCYKELEGSKDLKIIEISRQIDTNSSYGTSICLCNECRSALLQLLKRDI